MTLSTRLLASEALETLCAHGRLREALLKMAVQGLAMRFREYDTLLSACVSEKAIREGQRVHAHMVKTSYLPPVYLRTRLLVFYSKCDCLSDARQVLDEMHERNVVSWTAMISAYSQRGFASEALHLFLQMLKSGKKILFEFHMCCLLRKFSYIRLVSVALFLAHNLLVKISATDMQ